MSNSKISYGKILLDFIEITFIGSAIFLLVYFFVAQLLLVTGNSMIPNFLDGERLLAEKITYKLRLPERGEIVVFKHPQNPQRLLIKRVIGLPGDNFAMINGDVYINDKKLDEPYLQTKTKTYGGRLLTENPDYKVPEDTIIVLGDNREESSDSRDFGPIPLDSVVGRPILVYYPIKDLKFVSKSN